MRWGTVLCGMKTSSQLILSTLAALSAWLCYLLYSVYSTPGNFITSTDEIIRAAGYPCEVHKIQTEDGFILTVFRIPYGKGQEPGPRPSFWLQHGLVGSSDQFVQLGPGEALAFLLSDKGYDVWIGNARGNRYSLENLKYSQGDSQFWDFSWDEMGYYDLPAAISHVLNVTKAEKIFYAGHSMGAAMMMTLLANRPEFIDKIELVFALAPAIYMKNSSSVIFSLFCSYLGPFLLKILGPGSTLPTAFPQLQNWLSPSCSPEYKSSILCRKAYELTFGPTADYNPEIIALFYSTNPSQTSLRAMAHYGQSIETGEFKAFDFGETVNIKKYGSLKPPSYEIKNIRTPIVIMFSNDDYIVTPEDEYKLCLNLGHVIEYYKVPHSSFDHMDFLYGKSAKKLVYYKIFEILEKRPSILDQRALCNNAT